MLQIKRSLLAGMAISLLVLSCNEKGKEQTTDNKTKEDQTVVADPPKEESKEGMTIAAAKSFLDENEANAGKEITVSAYSWGSNDMMGGTVSLNLGDKKLEGFQQSTFSCKFEKDKAAAVKAIAKDAMVTVTGKIAKGSGGVELTDCTLH
ncbi:MAG: hypothetical protein IPG86_12415 [Chitinophagaceae bacterium]|nr:hypothetical protein [Chitinophagaceae bacterium]